MSKQPLVLIRDLVPRQDWRQYMHDQTQTEHFFLTLEDEEGDGVPF